MSRPSLFAEPKQTENADKKFLKRIDELIDESEIEAMAEIDKQIRYKNAKFALIALIAVALAALLYLGIENESLPDLPGQDQTAAVGPEQALPESLAPLKENSAKADALKETPPVTAETSKETTLEDAEQKAVTAISEALTSLDTSKTQTPSTEQPVEKAPVKPKATAPEPKAESKSNGLPANPPAGNYFVQVGAFSVKANADRMVKKLNGAGLPTQVSQVSGKSSRHTLIIGGFTSPDGAQFLMKELKTKGHSPNLVPGNDGNYAILLYQSSTRSNAESMKDKLGEEGIFTQIEKMEVSTSIHVIRVGGFASKDLAARYQKEIARIGYPKTLIRKVTQPAG
ncbi:SPOR domain-containing protein [Nitrospina watsonii]|uniref:SPOR domain-containing protein n=1 Tax=Nitrospina watsonii TaxID=1323948 RepID=A0ABM9HDG9_9BACT|nr:SPOR domain-containing protein [Nitrospina watsonii]CAI2718153.1 SPOR domain-containing protein [Nitrospina watsonii]